MKKIPVEKLLWFFEYSKEEGKLYWKNHWDKKTRTKFLGKEAGRTNQINYRSVSIGGTHYFIHRLIFAIETGQYPENVDHINGNTLDNRFVNLRAANRRQNLSNSYRHRKGKLVGTTFRKREQLWYSRITVNKKLKHLGAFKTELEAHQRYLKELEVRGLK